jgi:hypothetical protein
VIKSAAKTFWNYGNDATVGPVTATRLMEELGRVRRPLDPYAVSRIQTFVKICQNYRVILTNHGVSSERMSTLSRFAQIVADWLWWLKSGSGKGMGREGFEPSKA